MLPGNVLEEYKGQLDGQDWKHPNMEPGHAQEEWFWNGTQLEALLHQLSLLQLPSHSRMVL